ncbi:hypothetical protein EV204_1086 [Tissierella praeacuta]|uniref:hypothetical protein n=1 Tax=Tissierella praeacuta TaxID=43131 RepID=UPI00104CE857|nr:hypothetical protein [Tissierella praeacuta]TCU69649.1 hypothetical protein EV204_1086 [Tissierella praeacuta]
MHSEWRVTSNITPDGRKVFAVYRLIDKNAVDHSGNREFATDYMANRDDALKVAVKLNNEEGQVCE